MIYQRINLHTFRDAFKCKTFTYEALAALYGYYETLADETGEDQELCIGDIKATWHEYDDLAEALDDNYCDSLEELQSKTTVIEVPEVTYLHCDNFTGSVLVLNF